MGMMTNASSNWLLTGKGSPLNTETFDCDEEAYVYLDDLLTEDFTVYLVSCDKDWLVVCTLPIKYEVRRVLKSCLRIEIITGNLGHLTRNRLQEATATHQVLQVQFSRERFERLKAGQVSFGSALN
jgi:hypothetical protein